jgi:hypothetical protein
MKRRSDDGDWNRPAPDGALEAFLTRLLQKHRRLWVCIGIGLAVLAIAALVVARFSDRAQ